jgi:hypothetical protein
VNRAPTDEPEGIPADPWADSPWADDDAATAPQRAVGQWTASAAVLRPSVGLLIASTVVIFLSAVASSNAAPNSDMERVALGVHRIGMVAMLAGFVGILLAYRLPAASAMLQAKREDRIAAESKQPLLTADLRFLLLACGLLIAWVWSVTWVQSALLHQLTFWVLLVLAGLLANMTLLHRGTIRAFAVGTLVTLVLVLLTWRSLMAGFMTNWAAVGLGSNNYNMLFISMSIEVTLSLLSGLICAGYYNLVMRVRGRADGPLG